MMLFRYRWADVRKNKRSRFERRKYRKHITANQSIYGRMLFGWFSTIFTTTDRYNSFPVHSYLLAVNVVVASSIFPRFTFSQFIIILTFHSKKKRSEFSWSSSKVAEFFFLNGIIARTMKSMCHEMSDVDVERKAFSYPKHIWVYIKGMNGTSFKKETKTNIRNHYLLSLAECQN